MRFLILILSLSLILTTISFAQPDTLWTRTYGNYPGADWGLGVQQTLDGGFIAVGWTDNFINELDIYLIKVDESGDEVWSQTYGSNNYDKGYCVDQTNDGGYVIAGEYDSPLGSNPGQICLLKTDESGNQVWMQTYGEGVGKCVEQTDDGGYILVGSELIKTDEFGNESWAQAIDGRSVQQTPDGGYIVTGSIHLAAMNYDVFLTKTDSLGNISWTKTYGGSDYDMGFSVDQTSDGGYIVTGETVISGYGRLWLIKTDSVGDTLWTNIYTEAEDEHTAGRCVRQTSDGGYISVGCVDYTSPAVALAYAVKVDGSGNQIWSQVMPYGLHNECVQQTTDDGYIIAGRAYDQSDVLLIRLDAESNFVEDFGVGPLNFTLFPAYPNPFNQHTVLDFVLPSAGKTSIDVFDITGRKVAVLINELMSAGQHSVTFDAEGLTSGVYFVRLEARDFKTTQKLLLVK